MSLDTVPPDYPNLATCPPHCSWPSSCSEADFSYGSGLTRVLLIFILRQHHPAADGG
jgi:hypothetical protein